MTDECSRARAAACLLAVVLAAAMAVAASVEHRPSEGPRGSAAAPMADDQDEGARLLVGAEITAAQHLLGNTVGRCLPRQHLPHQQRQLAAAMAPPLSRHPSRRVMSLDCLLP